MTFRIAAMDMPYFIEKDDSGEMKGFYGRFVKSLFDGYVKNYTIVMPRREGTGAFFDRTNGNSSGINTMFVNNETDILFFPLDYGYGPSFLRPTVPVGASDGVASHSPDLTVRKQDIINSLNINSPLILYLICLSILLCGSFLLLSLRKHFKLEYFWRIGQCLLNQTNFGTKILLTCKILVIFWLIVSFLIMEVYEQAINADAVSFDYGSVVESLDDLVRHKEYRPIFVQNDFIRDQFESSLDSKHQEVWSRKTRKILEPNPVEVMKVGSSIDVHIGLRGGAIGATEFFCGQYQGRKYLIATKGFGVVNAAFYYRANLEKSQKDFFEYRSLLVGQGGIVYRLTRAIGDGIASLSEKSTHACICYSKEELYDDVETLQPMKVSNMKAFLGLIAFLFALSILAFMREFYRFLPKC